MHRFYLDENLGEGILVIKDKAILHQLRSVLRVQKGEQVIFFKDKNEFKGLDFVYELKNIERSSANFLFKEKKENTREPRKKLVLYQSLIKKEKFEQILQHATEVGAFEIVPVISARSEKKSLNQERCEKILREAAEQSGRVIVPNFRKVLDLEKAIESAKSSEFKTYFAHTKEKDHMIYGAGDRQVNLFIGPEGGWEEKEVFAFVRAGFLPVSLGRLTLRAETAAIVSSFTLLWG
ncbi:MAG TPA: RsmE family RNA methyltransferase [Candidatus Paceibacterota bacterium]